MSTNDIRAEVRAKLKHPFVKPEIVDAMIDHADYWQVSNSTTMVCCITLKNGFTVVDHTACVDPRNFDPEVGKRLSYSKARDQVFHYLAFAYLDGLSHGC